ncbi:MoaD/ThiS family protein [Flavobacterium soyangense]|uniref:MoaD/ThiS family protein n=1 Tax=Flavobacterium soyangense TaxID=2023265 RepID=A0A930UD03_9FLAO|nr:MoaD/ThiS family protein [Flavobacterium soyangense]MBF2709805.1 MoaD/ThiS family protein [Flavobacterium soyangense]
MILLKYFGNIAEKTKSNEEEIPYLDISLKQLIDELEQKYNLDKQSFSVAINQKIVQNIQNQKLKDNDIVALLPPFAGG